jgi:hypothetical protein
MDCPKIVVVEKGVEVEEVAACMTCCKTSTGAVR